MLTLCTKPLWGLRPKESKKAVSKEGGKEETSYSRREGRVSKRHSNGFWFVIRGIIVLTECNVGSDFRDVTAAESECPAVGVRLRVHRGKGTYFMALVYEAIKAAQRTGLPVSRSSNSAAVFFSDR
jgi:hypothetical protein